MSSSFLRLTAALALATIVALTAVPAGATSLAHGRYLVRLGDCMGCHTEPGHPPFSGGRALQTPFGVIYAPNITPDPETGIGRWSAADFYRAMHNGIAPGGRYLYPAFPFPSYTRLSRADVIAIWSYLRQIEPVHRRNRGNRLRFPYRLRESMRVWRLRFFRPGSYRENPQHSERWNRGAYLVTGVTHCGACHSPRNDWGAKLAARALTGGNLPIDGWLAPDITGDPIHGIGRWTRRELADFLTSGRSARGDAMGPMRDVVQNGLQYLQPADLASIIDYLRAVPGRAPATPPAASPPAAPRPGEDVRLARGPGRTLYEHHCRACHGSDGAGEPGRYPALRASSMVRAANPTNLILAILRGGFQAATASAPYPYSMPPFALQLANPDIAALATFVRREFGDRGRPVTAGEVGALR